MDCGKCGKSSRLEQLDVSCSGFCGRRFHKKCTPLCDYAIQIIAKLENVNFLCMECKCKYDHIKKEYADILKNIEVNNSVIKSVEIKIDSVINSMVGLQNVLCESIQKTGADLKNVIGESTSMLGQTKKTESLSYAEMVKLPIFVKSKKKDQCSETTKNEIKSVINPCAMSVEINNIQELKNNDGVIINCSNKESVEKFKNKLEEEIGADYEVSTPRLKNPNLLVVGMSDNISSESVIKAIKAQNNVNFSEIKCHKVYESFKKKGSYNAIIKVGGEAYKNLIKIGKLNIEWNWCMVYEHSSIEMPKMSGLQSHCQNM